VWGNTAVDDSPNIYLGDCYDANGESSVCDALDPEECYLAGCEWINDWGLLVSFSNIHGGYEGEENIDSNPLYTDPENDDYRLSWENYPTEDKTMSPCIDAGTADIDGDGEEDITDYFGTAPDMGAFEWYTEEPEYQTGDITMDYDINVLDVILLVAFIMLTDTPEAEEFALADMNGDGLLNVLDVVALVNIILGG